MGNISMNGVPNTRIPSCEFDSPELNIFVDYWNSHRKKAFAPSLCDFNLCELSPELLPLVIIADVIPSPLDFVIRFWGTGLRTPE